MNNTKSINYSGRLVDIELLQDITNPSTAMQHVQITNVGATPKYVTGIEKVIQRYTVALLTVLGDVHFAQSFGGPLIGALMRGTVSNISYLGNVFGITSASAIQALATDDQNTKIYGTIPADEQIVSAVLTDSNVDYNTGTVALSVTITTAAGSNYDFVVPVSTLAE